MTDQAQGPPPVHVALNRVLAELPAIGKTQRNAQQGFNFRGIDDVLNALNPLLSEHGVTIVPHRVLERVAGIRATAKGGTMYEVSLRVQYRIYGPAGDFIEAEGWGEGTDSGDKATPKAMTGALKYVLFQTFSISTEEASKVDADRHSPEESTPVRLAAAEVRNDLKARIAKLPEDARAALSADWKGTLTPLARLTADDASDAADLVALYEAKAQEKAPEKRPPAGPPATPAAAPSDADPGRPFEPADA